ncbi:MAG: DEAD/DEAH box helicase family protein [Chloroflexi bacterium]|nr:DEAD/DEAH box helicase family protein [Chloroflexota bacterium]
MSNFAFLKAEWPELYEAATRAEASARTDPRTACFYSRRALEIVVRWAYTHDRTLRVPYEDSLSALIHEPTFRNVAGAAVFNKARVIKDLGNEAVHSQRAIRPEDGVVAVRELFHVSFWLARTYGREHRPPDALAFDAAQLTAEAAVPPQTRQQLLALAAMVRERDEQLHELRTGKSELDDELKRLREEIAATKAANAATPDAHDYSEAQTRDLYIDLLLREAGWALDKKEDREYEVAGMPNNQGAGYVDYVLWGDDGLPLALVEAKRTRRDPREGQQQAKLYADCLEQKFGRRPVIFYSNGYEHWLWDDAHYPPRQVQGFLKKDELELAIQRRTTRQALVDAEINGDIVERYYQKRAIRRIGEAFEKDNERKTLLVMATGAGKTRTVIALCDLLMRRNWVKRVLFLADRVALVRQAVGEFKKHLPAAAPVNLVTEKNTEGRVYISTYPTMMGLIDETNDEERKFGVGHFDLVIIDEAHRSVYQKYGAIFEYFDSLLVGLTATPKDEIDRNTYRLFDVEDGVPTDAYGLDEAVNDGFLVPPKAVSVPLKFPREGIKYDELSEEEKDQWDALEWSEDGAAPDEVSAAAVNEWLFNKNTVDKVLAHVMTSGQHVAGGDRLGKTIIFAKNHDHAVFIEQRFNAAYPHYRGAFARVIDFKVEYAQSLIDDFSSPDKPPHIAISVDMLDTGIDVPEIVNLVFFKRVRSKTKFWQMIGRGTRLRPDLFAPGEHKQFFYIFDYLGNLEFFSQNPETTEGAGGDSLSKRLFTRRLQLAMEIARRLPSAGPNQVKDEQHHYADPTTDAELKKELIETLHGEVAAMNVDNFVVRPQRKLVEQYAKPESWVALTGDDADDLAGRLAGLPSEQTDDDEEAKRFDLLMLRLQLAVVRGDTGYEKLRRTVVELAASMEEQSSIPMVRDQLELIQEVQMDAFWQDVTAPMLERVRKRLRALVKLIEKAKRTPIYVDFEDVLGPATMIELPGLGGGADFEQFRKKALNFLRSHEDIAAVHKLRMNQPLTAADLSRLERVLIDEGVGSEADLDRAKRESQGLGLFIRSLVGLDREAAKQAFGQFLADRTATANQIEFVNLIIDHLTEHGVMSPSRLYESPFTDINPQGPDSVFPSAQVDALVALLQDIRARAAA